MSGSHEKLPWLFWVQLVLVAIVAALFFMKSGEHSGATHGEGNVEGHEASKQALKPIGDVAVSGGAGDAAAGGNERSGKDIVNKTCQTCHVAGIANAPKMDESGKADWEARMAKGLDEMVAVAKVGKGAMPPMGTDPTLSDAELKNAIVYMLEKAGVDAGSSSESSTGSESSASTEATTTSSTDAEMASAPNAPTAPQAPEPPVTPETPSTAVVEAAAASVATAATAATATVSEAAAEAKETVTEAVDEAKPSIDGAKLYRTTCFACHDTGVAGAPKLGDKAAWADRIAQGKEVLYTSAINGKTSPTGVMPAKGGYVNLTDDEVKAIVDHMVAKSE